MTEVIEEMGSGKAGGRSRSGSENGRKEVIRGQVGMKSRQN